MPSRRSFFKTLAVAAAGFSILPPATTYQRVWRATRMLYPANSTADIFEALKNQHTYTHVMTSPWVMSLRGSGGIPVFVTDEFRNWFEDTVKQKRIAYELSRAQQV